MRHIFVILILLASCINPPLNSDNATPQSPLQYTLEEYAKVPGARSLAYLNNTLYVGTRGDKVYEVKNGTASIILEGLNSPNGVAIMNGDLYIAEINRVIVMRNIQHEYRPYEIITDTYPTDPHHGWKYIAFGPDNLLYVPIGAPCNACNEGDPYATLTALNVTTGQFEIVARGIRNTVGFDWDEQGRLWFTDNGRDWWGDDLPPDELNLLEYNGQHFGYPFCHGNQLIDDEFNKENNCDKYTPPQLTLGPHVAALGIEFIPELKGALIAEHGSWNRKVPIGYRVMFIPFENGVPIGYEEFIPMTTTAIRPVDIENTPNGIFISDDKQGKLYRLSPISN